MRSTHVFLLISLISLWIPAASLQAGSSLLYLEAQGLMGGTNQTDDPIFYTNGQMDAMQKPSLGFDYVQRLTRATGDMGVLAIQGRLAYNEKGEQHWEPQLYNAYLRFKNPVSDLWIGHDKPAMGLSFVLDNHGELLHNYTMHGFGYDRDWGAGLSREFAWGDFNASLTSGSGMPLYWRDNYLAAARISHGILAQDNYNVGLSYSQGDVLNTVGYHLPDGTPHAMSFLELDGSLNFGRLELREDILHGTKQDIDIDASLTRITLNLLPENRLKLEAQPVFMTMNDTWNYKAAFGLTYLLHADWTVRSLWEYDHKSELSMAVLQLYYYHKLF